MVSNPVSILGQSPPSNLILLPQLGGMTFSITTTGGWYDVLLFTDQSTGNALNLSGIAFRADLRIAVGDPQIYLSMNTQTSPPSLVNGGANGTLYFSVDVSLIKNLKPATYVMDLLATDTVTGMIRNLCEVAPIAVTVIEGITI